MNDTPPPAGFGRRLGGALLAGALLAALVTVAAGFLINAVGRVLRAPGTADAYRRFLAGGGWAWLPAWGAALGAAWALRWASSGRQRVAAALLALALAVLPVVWRPALPALDPEEHPRTAAAKARALRRWSFRSPATVRRVLELSRDPDARVREQAVLTLGVNLIVSDIERATPGRPSRYADLPLRDSLRVRLLEELEDPVEAIRAEAARALWKAPRAFGRQPAAAETLAAVLRRAARSGSVERLAWLALDAAGGEPEPRLRAAAAEFAAATRDSDLARAARRAAFGPR